MRLTSFTVSNFRSITAAKKVSLTDYSVLVGANNEGKSNILHALAIGLEAIEDFKHSVRRDKIGRIIGRPGADWGARSMYNWERDFPIAKRADSGADASTEVIFEFRLSEFEVASFQREFFSKTNGVLPVSILLGAAGRKISIPKQGPGSAALNAKANKVADFVSRNITFEYIPAVRTSEAAELVISDLVSRELAILEADPDYKDAIEKINSFRHRSSLLCRLR